MDLQKIGEKALDAAPILFVCCATVCFVIYLSYRLIMHIITHEGIKAEKMACALEKTTIGHADVAGRAVDALNRSSDVIDKNREVNEDIRALLREKGR